MGLLSGKTMYGGWAEKSAELFTEVAKKEVELQNVTRAVVTESTMEDGTNVKSVCFFMKSGNHFYEKVDRASVDNCSAGDVVDLNTCKIITISKPGEPDKTRIRL